MANRKKKADPVSPVKTPDIIDVVPVPTPGLRRGTPEAAGTALVQTASPIGPMSVLQRAVSEGASVDTLERLLGMQERWEQNQAKKAFDAAMAAVRQTLPTVIKKSVVDFTSDKGRTHYRYEDLSAVTEAVSPVLHEHGLSFRWHTDNVTDPTQIVVTCILSHAQGHTEKTALSAKADNSGNKNTIQAIGSAVTYLQRYTLKAALGLAAAVDDDGLTARTEQRQNAATRERAIDIHGDEVITVGYKDTRTQEKHYGQLERLKSIQRKSGRPDHEVSVWLKAVYGYNSSKEILRKHYDAIVSAIEAPGPLPAPQDREPGEDD